MEKGGVRIDLGGGRKERVTVWDRMGRVDIWMCILRGRGRGNEVL